ncbi:TetR-like C-terminal domain-containing protein [Asticcacaulis sp. ZE23SCel15]|uniref:TetR/AcrR family transcriptional regulator n=1 Tax=Asticcacaulis sp. ZE23SCel15 TaxID=3059027 RepID=UPI00265E7198|nr:TetR-like C-terminal domain-containing protein [Asticcacaulis sp. ZE23SCel15]WKL58801.1 TetR-like C-terminal domain-containing protein [Asticcacaulis sp. ZE23SCel15]
MPPAAHTAPTPSTATTARRQAQLDALINSAEKRIAAEGIDSLKARDLAADVGIALGGLYNLVEDMEMLYLRVAQRTMIRLDQALTEAAGSTMVTSEDAVARLEAVAHAYYRFARGNLLLWRALFEMRLKSRPLPEWNISAQLGLFGHVAAPLKRLMPDADDMAVTVTARTLFSAVHGIVVIALEERIIAIPSHAVEDQISWLMRATCKSL